MSKNIAQDMADSAINLDDCMNAMKDFVGQMIAAIALLDARLAVLESKLDDKIENLAPKSEGGVVMSKPLED
jgi:hypothetical protein